MEHPIMFLALVAELFGESAGEFVHHYPHLVYSWFIMIILIVLARLATAKVSMVPSGLQNVFEFVIESLEGLLVTIMGEGGRRFFPFLATIFIFVLFSNFQGLIPGSFAPTANLNTTAGLALLIFILTHSVGIWKHGFRYIKHFLGPMAVLAPLMFIIEVVSHLSRLVSLSLRLFGNVMGEELVILILFVLAGAYFVPLPMMLLCILLGFLQAFIITLLGMIYVSESLHESH